MKDESRLRNSLYFVLVHLDAQDDNCMLIEEIAWKKQGIPCREHSVRHNRQIMQ